MKFAPFFPKRPIKGPSSRRQIRPPKMRARMASRVSGELRPSTKAALCNPASAICWRWD